MKRLLVYLTDYKKECVIAPAFKMLEALFDLLVPLVMAAIINTGIPAGDTRFILSRCGVLVLLGVVGLTCSITAQYFAAVAAVGFSARVRRALFSHIQRLRAEQLDSVGPAALITRMTSDVTQVQNGVNMALRLLLRSPFIVLGSLVLAFTIDLRCALVFAVTVTVLFVIVFGIMALTIPGYRQVQSGLDAVTAKTRENLTGVRVVRAFHREEDERAAFRAKNDALNRAQRSVGHLSSLMNPLTYVVINLALIGVLWFGGLSIQSGTLRQGDVIALVNYLTQVLVELVKLANMIVLLTRSLASAGRIADVLALPVGEQAGDAAVEERGEAVRFDGVGIAYAGSCKESLSGVTFTARWVQTIGVIGGTGSGTSTLVSLIPRLYDATAGTVSVFGRPVADYDPRALRRAVGVVPQRAQLFSGTIRSNLCFGAEGEVSEDLLWAALETAQAAEFVRGKPLGLDEPVEQGGRNLSGGQRQRLTIARALVPQPPILILDDSASALDYATDARLRRALRELPGSPTVFIVSQRVSSLQHADLILVLDDGQVVGHGVHRELLQTCPVYR
ncbi:MAG: ABC transporter ATP-binding protein [Oscillospiraceae bacterium]|nr:ABC transporter ATP-binding protein [Oscillospiraceae bacterium]